MGSSDKKTVWIHPEFAKLIGRDVPKDGWVEPATRPANPSSPNLHIPSLGPLRPVSQIPEWLESGPISIPFFDGEKLTVTLQHLKEEDEPDVETAVSAFLRLGPQDRLAVSHYVLANYQFVAGQVSEEDLGCRIESAETVWAHVQPSQIYVARRPRRDCAIYISIAANCDWEPEHGLQIVYRRGTELVRVSEQDGHLTHTDASDLPEDQDRIVS